MKFDWNDISLKAANLIDFDSRSEINLDYLPIITAPMDTVVDKTNADKFLKLGFNVCLPRGEDYKNDNIFKSFGLSEIEEIIQKGEELPKKVLIDIANGHLRKLYDISKIIKENYKVELMVGNIANPDTYIELSKINVDYIRVGVGGGAACTTSANGAVHYPMASLVSEIYEYKKGLESYGEHSAKIVADGGFKNFSDIIKAIALGADYVMLGSILNKALESCSKCLIKDGEDFNEISLEKAEKIWKKIPVYKNFRGMSTKEVQKKWKKEEIKTAEGISFVNKVEYTLEGWLENFTHYLKSAMSYTNSKDLKSFKESQYIFISENAFKRFNK